MRVVGRNSEQVAGFETGRFRGLVVTVGSAANANNWLAWRQRGYKLLSAQILACAEASMWPC